MKHEQTFYYISGRGWVTVEPARCPTCHQLLGTDTERHCTKAEVYGLILPTLKARGGTVKSGKPSITVLKVVLDIIE